MPASTVAGCGKQKPANVSSEQDSNSKSSRVQGESMTTWGEHIKTWFKGSWRSVIFIGKPSWVWGPSAPASGLWVHTPGSRQLGSQWCTRGGMVRRLQRTSHLWAGWWERSVSDEYKQLVENFTTRQFSLESGNSAILTLGSFLWYSEN